MGIVTAKYHIFASGLCKVQANPTIRVPSRPQIEREKPGESFSNFGIQCNLNANANRLQKKTAKGNEAKRESVSI